MNKRNILSKKWSSCPSQLSDIRKNIKEVCLQLAYSEEDANQIVLAIDEACTNIMRYAYNHCRDGTIQIEITRDTKQVIFKLHDFAEQVSKDCIKVKSSSPLKPGGLGVSLMQQIMDSIEFVHTKETNGNILEMKKKLPKEST